MCYREEFTSERYVCPLPFFSFSDFVETSQAHFPTLRKGKMEKDAHGKCLNYLKNTMYDILSFLLQGNFNKSVPFVRSLLQNLICSYTISLSGVVVIGSRKVEVTINTISNIVAVILLIKVKVYFLYLF